MSKKFRCSCLVLICLPILYSVFVLLYAEWAWGGRLQTTLEPRLIPTAQYLLQTVAPKPTWLSIYPAPSSIYSESAENITIAVKISPNFSTTTDVAEWTRIFINGERISRLMYAAYICGEITPDMKEEQCFMLSPELEPGLHLFRIQVGTSIDAILNPDPSYSYEWAYKVE